MFYTVNIYFILTVILIILFYFHLTRNFNHWKNKNVAYIKPIPIFGNVYKIFTLKISIGEFVAELYNATKSPYLGFFVFDQPFLLIRDPELIKRCLVKDFDYFDDRSVIENRKDDDMGSSALFVLKNPTWKPVRVKFTPVFSTGRIKGMLPLMLEASDDLVNYLNKSTIKSTQIETREMAMKFTTDVISSCAFGINSYCFRNEKATFREASRRIFDWSFGRKVSMASYFFAPTLVKLFKMKLLEPNAAKFIAEIFKSTMEEREKTKHFRGDLIDALIEIKNQEVKPGCYQFDEKMLAAQAAQFFVAGFETTGSTISFTLYELALNPSVQTRLRGEIQNAIINHGGITYEAIQDMTYLDMAIKETLRKFPVVPFIDRRCTKPYKIPETDVTIEKGIPVYVPLFGLHFDPKYFPDPEKYDPERFTVENKSTRPAYSYIPFGEGPRNCIGARFGVLGTKVAIIRILVEFEVVVCNDTPVPLKFDAKGFVIAPTNGVEMDFKKLD